MKYNFIIAFLLFTLPLFAQQKGVSPLKTQNSELKTGSTYAVVVGISDYQDEGIPDLHFADKDAKAFAGFLQSPAGGSLDEDHLKVLTNQAATAGQLASALYWLMDECREGDQAIIYFSGHGDVESQTFSQPGYLLCWDAPSKVYMAGGTLAIPMFQLVVSTLSLEKKAKVIVLTDACRAGKLAGSSINGSKLTSSNLSEQFANELKILSCQPDEYSIEGEQWGGGRGAFSYHLVDGLYGLADGNKDLSVSLMEVGRYLQDHVSVEVAPHNQLPMTVGNPREVLATVDNDLLERVKQRKENSMPVFTSTETKGIEDEVLSLVDSTTQARYKAFQKALADKRFFEPETDCAEYYFNQLIGEPLLAKLHSGMRRNYAAELQDDAQQVINKYLVSDAETCSADPKRLREYRPFPRSLKRAAELLGEDHYMTSLLHARSLWFEGCILAAEYTLDNSKEEYPAMSVAKYKKALTFQPDMVLALIETGFVYGYLLAELDSADLYYERALELCPNWLNGLFLYQQYLQYDKGDMAKAKIWADKMEEIAPNSALTHLVLGDWHNANNNFSEAVHYWELAFEENPTKCEYQKLLENYLKDGAPESLEKAIGLTDTYLKINPEIIYTASYVGMLHLKRGRPEEARKWILEMRKKSSDAGWHGTYVNLSQYYFELGEYEKAKEQFGIAIGLRTDYSAARWLNWWSGYWPDLFDHGAFIRKVIEWFPEYPHGYYEYAVFLSEKGENDIAFRYLEMAFEKGFRNFELLNAENSLHQDRKILAPLRHQKDRWEALMNKYTRVQESIELGQNYYDRGKLEEAEQAWLLAFELDSSSYTLSGAKLLKLYAETNQTNQIDTFLHTFFEKYSPTNVVYLNLGKSIFRYFPEKALPLFMKSIELDSLNPMSFIYAAVTYSYMEDGDEAKEMELSKKAFDLVPGQPLCSTNIAFGYLRQNRIENTEKYAQLALENSPDYLLAHGVLSLLYFQNGMLEKANEQIRMAMKKDAKQFLSQMKYCVRLYIMDPSLTSAYFRHIEKLYPQNPLVNLAIAGDLAFFRIDDEEAFLQLEKSIQKGLSDPSGLRGDYFISLRSEKNRWNEVIKERFPELVKEN